MATGRVALAPTNLGDPVNYPGTPLAPRALRSRTLREVVFFIQDGHPR